MQRSSLRLLTSLFPFSLCFLCSAKDAELKCLFIDVGHSTTQVSLVSFTEGKLSVLATAADRNLGGRDFDEVLVQHFKKYILDKYKMDVSKDVKAMSKLRKEVRTTEQSSMATERAKGEALTLCVRAVFLFLF